MQADQSRQIEEGQQGLYAACVKAAKLVSDDAHALMPARFWSFDRDRDRQRLNRLRSALDDLLKSQGAFEGSLTPEYVLKFDSEVHRLHELQAELESRVQSLDHEVRKHQPEKWQIATDTSAIPGLAKELKKKDQKIAQGIGILR